MSEFPQLMDYYNAVNKVALEFEQEYQKVLKEKNKLDEKVISELKEEFEKGMQESTLVFCFDLEVSHQELGKVFKQHVVAEDYLHVSIVPNLENAIRIDHHIKLNKSKVYSKDCSLAKDYLTEFFKKYGIAFKLR